MEIIFDDLELNKRANIIVDFIKTAAAPGLGGGMMSSFSESGLQIASQLLEKCLPELLFIKSKVGHLDQGYLYLSDALAVTTGAIVKMPVSSISMLANTSDFKTESHIAHKFKADLAEATRLMKIISNFDLSIKAREIINQNINRLNEAERRVNKTSSGCYIATCIYGSYNAKEVLIFRAYRDNVLSLTPSGLYLIRLYYYISPIIVKSFGKSEAFRKSTKILLDFFIKKL
jgi:hypothetical protein